VCVEFVAVIQPVKFRHLLFSANDFCHNFNYIQPKRDFFLDFG
jgi:hypothetical protein